MESHIDSLILRSAMSSPGNSHPWWSVAQLADYYSVSLRCVYRAVETGTLVSHRFGSGHGAIRIQDSDRIEWELRCRNEKAARPAKTSRARDLSRLVKKHFRVA